MSHDHEVEEPTQANRKRCALLLAQLETLGAVLHTPPIRRASRAGAVWVTRTTDQLSERVIQELGHDASGAREQRDPPTAPTMHVILDPLTFVGRLTALVPRPRVQAER